MIFCEKWLSSFEKMTVQTHTPILLRAPNRNHPQEVEVIKLFRTRTQVEYKSVISPVSSI